MVLSKSSTMNVRILLDKTMHHKTTLVRFLRLRRLIFLAFALNTLIGACKTIPDIKPQTSLNEKLPQYWLTTSMHAGRFYDNDQVNLMDCRPFSAIRDVETVDGFVLYPPQATHTIPAGTLVTILDVSHPDDRSKITRPIYSPRDHIWVYLKVAKERGQVSLFRDKPYVLVIPKNITNEAQIRAFLGRFFAVSDPNAWILSLPSYLQNSIFSKRPIAGMKKEHVMAAVGPAIKKQFKRASDDEKEQEIWHYHDYLVTLENGIVSTVRPLSPVTKSNGTARN